MAERLGTLEDLPQDYRDAMTAAGVAPLWPMMRNVLPHGVPRPQTRPGYWNYDALRPLLLRAGELTPVEKAERRVLVLSDPGRGPGAMQATASIYLGLQLLLPGETAPAHVHTPSAVRIMVEGKGAFTVVDGEKLPMEEGDLVLTPGVEWRLNGKKWFSVTPGEVICHAPSQSHAMRTQATPMLAFAAWLDGGSRSAISI